MARGVQPLTAPPSARSVVVIGAGLVGVSCAWLLRRRGHHVLLIDAGQGPSGPAATDPLRGRGSEAALGVLMARVFHRSRGRGWRLRQRSLELWQVWRQELHSRGRPVPWRPGLLLLAAGQDELQRQLDLQADRQRPPGSLELWDRARLEQLRPRLPAAAPGGLFSGADGQLDPLVALEALLQDGIEAGLQHCPAAVEALEPTARGWRVHLDSGAILPADWVVVAAGLGSAKLLPEDPARPPVQLQPVLGQAVELELDAADSGSAPDGGALSLWPGAVVWRGINLILRPARCGGADRLWLGATLEPGAQAAPEALQRLLQLEGEAPDWLLRARCVRGWQGLRARPVGQPAPLLQDLGDGLLLAGGHYRNGVLLAPASAEWVAERIEAARWPASEPPAAP